MYKESIWLRYTGDYQEYYVTIEDYEKTIRPLIMQLRICGTCGRYYEPNANPPRPCVARRICMECMLAKHEGFRFLEVQSVNDEGEATYAFINESGEVYTSRENYHSDITKDIVYSLKQNGFTAPEKYKPVRAEEEIKLSSSHFTIYGDLSCASVVVADYSDTWSKVHATFLLYKNAGYKELTKRGEGKVLYERAEAMLQRTKKGSYYYINGHEQSRIWDSDIFAVISQMESSLYDIGLQFGPPLPVEEPKQVSEDVSKPETTDTDQPKKRRGRPPLRVVQSTDSVESEEPILQEDTPIEERAIGEINIEEETNEAETIS